MPDFFYNYLFFNYLFYFNFYLKKYKILNILICIVIKIY